MSISTHVLDTSKGTPAPNITLTLDIWESHGSVGTTSTTPDGDWNPINTTATNADGRAPGLVPANHLLTPGTYRLTFHTQPYFDAQNLETFYPRVEIFFKMAAADQHYHVPLLLSPFGFSTYRGS